MRRIPEARFLNLEYLFNSFIHLLRWLTERLLELAAWLGGQVLLSIIISALALAGIIFVLIKVFYLRRKKVAHLVDFFMQEEEVEVQTEKWDEIKKMIDSEDQANWRAAILEADSLADEIIKKIGYEGRDLGERLKNIEPSDFENLQNVWEAHKIRNKIVHEGEAFEITKEEAKKTIEKYQKALKELRYI